MIAFIPVAMSALNHKKGAITYFVCQSCGSIMVVIGGILSDHSPLFFPLILAGLGIKMGLMPFHFWVPQVVPALSRINLYLLISWQKIAPLVMLLSSTVYLGFLSVLNAIGGALTICSISLLPLVLIFSGIVQIG